VLGVSPLEPGYAKMRIAPQPGALAWARGKVPTALGPVGVKFENGATFRLELDLPAKANTSVAVPQRAEKKVLLDGKPVQASAVGTALQLEVPAGHHVL